MAQISRWINRLANKQRRCFDAMNLGPDLTSAQGKVLHYLLHRSETPTFQRDIEEEFGFRPPTASALLKSLEANGFIARTPLPDDARRKTIALTEKGRACQQSLDGEIASLERRLTAGIPPDQLSAWREVTERMIQNL